MSATRATRTESALLWIQGIYFLATGVWPLVHLPSFLAVTGPKHDLWLVQTVGAVIGVIGLSLCVAGTERVVNAGTVVLAAGCAAALMAVDLVFTSRGVIPPVYLLDAIAEGVLLIAWAGAGVAHWRAARGTGPKRWRHHLAMAWR